MYMHISIREGLNRGRQRPNSVGAEIQRTERWESMERALRRGRARFSGCVCQKINRSNTHAHDSRTNHSHEHRASNGATTLKYMYIHRSVAIYGESARQIQIDTQISIHRQTQCGESLDRTLSRVRRWTLLGLFYMYTHISIYLPIYGERQVERRSSVRSAGRAQSEP